jgi:hypothetical protein
MQPDPNAQPDPYAQPQPATQPVAAASPVVVVQQQQQQQQPIASPYGGAPIVAAAPSPAPTVIGILVIIWGAFGVLGSLWNLTQVSTTISTYEELDIVVPTAYLWVSPIIALVSAGVLCGGGVMLLQRQKLGVWLGFAGIGVATLNGIIGSLLMGGAMEELGEGMGALVGGMGIVFTLFCNVICAVIVAIPLMIATSNLE